MPDSRGNGETEAGSRFDELHPSQRIAYGTGLRAFGEILAKPARSLFYIVMARELGQAGFGVFMFGLSLTTVLLVLGGLGLQQLVAREVARDRGQVDELVWNVLVLKAAMMVVLLAVAMAIVTAGDYSSEGQLATLIVGIGVGLENLTSILSAVFQAFERQQHIATALLINRFSTAALGITALLAGAGLVPVAALTAFGSALGLVTAYVLMQRRVVRPRREIAPGAWPELVRRGFPLGVVGMLGQTVLGSSVVLLGVLTASEAEVGDYSAAFRLIEATIFISWSFSSAAMPWFSRHSGERAGAGGLARGFELALKGVISAMLPVALILALFAEPVVDLLYGSEYDGAIEPLRILAAMTVLWGINGTVTAVLVGRARPGVYLVPAITAILLTVVLALILMPDHGAVGAAIATVPAAAALGLLAVGATVKVVGPVNPLRVLVAPLLAGGALAGVASVLSGAPWPLAAALALAAYALVFLAIERSSYPDDYAHYRRIMGARRRPAETS